MKILITGGASGLGKAITINLASVSENYVYFTYQSSRESARQIETLYPNAKGIYVDFTNTNSLMEFVNYINELCPDILINNAITGFTQNHFHKISSDIFISSFERNIYPVLLITQKFIATRRKKKGGKIITILTSAILNRPLTGWSEYTANKAYLYSMAKSWAVENESFGITSNCISPSFMKTNLTSLIDSRVVDSLIEKSPNNELLKESDVAEVIRFLISATTHINGHNFIINAAKDLL